MADSFEADRRALQEAQVKTTLDQWIMGARAHQTTMGRKIHIGELAKRWAGSVGWDRSGDLPWDDAVALTLILGAATAELINQCPLEPPVVS